jgi:plasmid stabilization system protein ParE
MLYPVRYSTRAYIEYEDILEYVSGKFGIAIAAKVDTYFEGVVNQISINPFLYPYSDKKKNLRRCVINSKTTLYYRFSGEIVELVSFRGNKMNPKSLGI